MIFTIDIVDIISAIIVIGIVVITIFVCVMYKVEEMISEWFAKRKKKAR